MILEETEQRNHQQNEGGGQQTTTRYFNLGRLTDPFFRKKIREEIQLRQEKLRDVFFRNCSSHRILRVNKIP